MVKKILGKKPFEAVPSDGEFIPHFFSILIVLLLLPSVLIINRPVYGAYPSYIQESLLTSDKTGKESTRAFSRHETHIFDNERQGNDNQNLLTIAKSEDNKKRNRLFCQYIQTEVYNPQSTPYSLQTFTTAPKVITGSASNVLYDSVTLSGTVNAHGLSTTAWFQYRIVDGPARNTYSTQTVIGTSDTEISTRIINLLPGTTYYYRIAARNDAGTVYGDEMSFTTPDTKTYVSTDITPPTGSISINNDAYITNSPIVTVNLSASDNTGVTGYYLSASATPPSSYTAGWTSITPVTNYQEDVSYSLRDSDNRNTVYVWYKDASGNISAGAGDSITMDTTPPTITITDPTSHHAYTTTSKTISISGNASDSTSEITSVVWSNSAGKTESERKTIDWTISNIDLQEGDNMITVKATDSLGNTGTATITITYTAAVDNPPVVITGPATGITTDLATLTGTVNAMGLPATAWFQYGTSSGSYSYTSTIQSIEAGLSITPIKDYLSELLPDTAYYYRIAAQNPVGITYGSEMIFTTAPPKGNISGYVTDSINGKPIESVRLRLKGTKARKKAFRVVSSDADGFFEFEELDANTYDIFVSKTDFKSISQKVELKEGEEKKVEMKLILLAELKKEIQKLQKKYMLIPFSLTGEAE